MTGVVRPIAAGWVVAGDRVPGPDVDEFAEPDQVVAALAAPGAADTDSLLAVQHPHRTPAALAGHRSVADVLPDAKAMLDRLRSADYRPVRDVLAPYLVSGPDGTAVGLLCLVDPAVVDAEGKARIRHSEDVYPRVVADRVAVQAGLGCVTSAALLVPVTGGAELTEVVDTAIDRLGTPAVTNVDSAGRTHQLWLLGPGVDQDTLVELAGRHPLLVADGNHRVAAAAAGDPPGLLALVTAGPDVRVGAIHRTLVGTGYDLAGLVAAWRQLDLTVVDPASDARPRPGTVLVRGADRNVLVELPPPDPDEPLPRIDHAVVEHLLVGKALGIDPAGPHVRPLPPGAPAPAGADAVLELAPVPYADVLAVHGQGRRMPRKSTYFTPKPRSGLLLAGLR